MVINIINMVAINLDQKIGYFEAMLCNKRIKKHFERGFGDGLPRRKKLWMFSPGGMIIWQIMYSRSMTTSNAHPGLDHISS